MKNLKTIAIALFVALGTTVASAQIKKINVQKSKINWVGKKITGEHSGTVNFKEGSIVFQKEVLKGGSFTVDMTSLTATDLKGEWKDKLDGHLKAEDFFGTDKFETSTLKFVKITSKGNGVYNITADLTIKDITKPVTFDLTVKGNTASAKFSVDRTKYDIKYGSKSFFDGLGDKTINDDFELSVNLQF
jgi:polyisoprenoid-binding protein YceI